MADRVFVGTYTRRGSEGIYSFRVEPETGKLSRIGCAPCEHPSFITFSPDRRYLYAVNELGEFLEQQGGGASSFEVDWSTGALRFLNEQPVHGADPCHAHVDPSGRWLATANYTGGSHSILPIEADGRLGSMQTLLQHSQSGDARAHSSQFSRDGKLLYACTLGLNQVIAHEFDVKSGMANPADRVELPAGSGPRHQALHPALPLLYVINEHGSTVSALSCQGAKMEVLQTLPTTPADFAGKNACADLHLSPDGRFLYGSNRGHNSLAVFAIGGDGLLSALGHVSTGGDCPRGFGVLDNGLILVANERSDNIVAFRIGADGIPIPTGAVTDVPSPTCVLA